MKRALLCDPALASQGGHCHPYLLALSAALGRAGWSASLYGNRQAEASLVQSGVMPSFSLRPDERAPTEWDELRDRHEAAFAADLVELSHSPAWRDAELVVFNTLHHWSLRALFRFFAEHRPAPALAVILHFSPRAGDGLDAVRIRMYRDAFDALGPQDRVALLADTVDLVQDFTALAGRPVALAPIPHSAEGEVRPRTLTLTIGFIGEARFHKGFHLLPFAVRDTAGLAARFLLQSFTHDPAADYYRKTSCHLAADPRVTLLGEALSPAAFDRFLGQIDVALLPYSTLYYGYQSSGVFADCMARGIPAIVTAATWMAREIERSGAGLITAPEDHAGLADAIRQFVAGRAAFERAARAESVRWRQQHGPDALAAAILRGVGGP